MQQLIMVQKHIQKEEWLVRVTPSTFASAVTPSEKKFN